MPHLRASVLVLAMTLTACATSAGNSQHERDAALMGGYLKGRYADLTNDPNLAAQNYLTALKRAPGDPVLVEGAVDSALVAGDINGAVAAAKVARTQGSDSPLGRLTLAVAALQTGRYAEAHAYVKATEGPPFDRLATRVLRAWALAGENKADQALAALDEPGESAPFSRLFDFQRAMILQYAGRTDAALKTYASASASGLRTPAGVVEYGELLQRLGRTQEAVAVYKSALEGGAEPNIAAALARAQQVQPPAPSALTKPARGAAIGMLTLASMLLGQTDADFYLPYLTLALALDPTLDTARVIYAEGLQDMHQWATASAALEQVPQGSPLYERALVQHVLLLREQDKIDEALERARHAVEQTQGALARLALADLLRDQEKWSEAEPIYDALLHEGRDDAPDEWRLYFARGACLERMNRWSEAEADLRKALALSPDQPEVLNYLGYSWIDQGINLKEGMKLIERAVALKPDAGYIVDSLGWAYYKLGDYRPAVEYLERAVELLPDDPILNDHLGDAYWREGRRAEARFQWTRSLSLKPTQASAERLHDKLAKGLSADPVRRTAHAEEKR